VSHDERDSADKAILKREAIIPIVTTQWIWTYVLMKAALVLVATAVMMMVSR